MDSCLHPHRFYGMIKCSCTVAYKFWFIEEMRHPKAFPRQRSCRFRGIERPENSPVESFQRDGAGRPVVGGFPGKCLHCSGKDGRGRSSGIQHANRRYRRGTDLFRPGLAAGPPSPEGEGFWSRQPLFLIPNPYSLIPAPLPHKSEFSPLPPHTLPREGCS